MESRNLDKALDIVSKLILGEEVAESGINAALYQEYNTNPEVYDIVQMSLKKMNLCVYEYHNSLFAGPGENNGVFGYSNEELRRQMGLRLNKEMYLAYFIIYHIITEFYTDTVNTAYAEFVQAEDIMSAVDKTVGGMIDKKNGFVAEEVAENSFTQIALSWDELPAVTAESGGLRAARNSKAGFVKLVCNFLVSQDLLENMEERYYPTYRFRAFIENYFDNSRAKMAQLLKGGEEEIISAAD